MNDIPPAILNMGGWGVVAWMMWYGVTKLLPVLQGIVKSLDDLSAQVKNQTEKKCDVPLDTICRYGRIPASSIDDSAIEPAQSKAQKGN